MRAATPIWMDWKNSADGLSISCCFSTLSAVLCHRAATSDRPFPWRALHWGEGEQYLLALTVVKPAWGTEIRFLAIATAWPLEADRLHFALPQLRSALHQFFTRTGRWLVSKTKFYLSLFQLVLLCRFFNLFVLAVTLLLVFCLNLESGPFKCIFATHTTVF